jgi:hypothetical protein
MYVMWKQDGNVTIPETRGYEPENDIVLMMLLMVGP